MSESKTECPYCKRDANIILHNNLNEYNCSVCGKFYIYNDWDIDEIFGINNKLQIRVFLFYNKSIEKRFLGTEAQFKKINNQYSKESFNHISLDEINSFWPHSFTDKISKILLWLDSHTTYSGEVIRITHGDLQSLFFINTDVQDLEIDEQYRFFTDYLYHHKKYIYYSEDDEGIDLSLKPFGFERIEDLHLDKQNNKKVFVSMAFNDNTDKTREAIKQGIIEAGYDATLIIEIIHNRQIMPEMFRLIRESRLLVMDITEPNYGAYYEAGYAQGLGKEVIITCSEERFYKKYESEEEKKYEKYLKPHFDIAQKQILLWKDTDDLTKKLKEWIKAIE